MPADACIGSLEHHIHKVFASVRVPGEDFVYSPSADLYGALDSYCDDRSIGETNSPFLILGQSGTGKSALLSNWLQRRKRQAMRSRSTDEFIFWHAVGCSRQSLNINSLIRRLIMDLKARFEITRDVPTTQERLSWELPRFLELASKRGKVIVIVDGLHRIATNDSSEANLAWLPLILPPGVRFVLSATTPAPVIELRGSRPSPVTSAMDTGRTNLSNMDGSLTQPRQEVNSSTGRGRKKQIVLPHEDMNESAARFLLNRKQRSQRILDLSEVPHSRGKSASRIGSAMVSRGSTGKRFGLNSRGDKFVHGKSILMELERRRLKILKLIPLERTACRAMVDAYIQKSVKSGSSFISTGPFLTSLASDEMGSFLGTLGGSFDSRDCAVGFSPGGKPAGKKNGNIPEARTPGFLLFECQIVTLLQHSQGSTPLFLRLFLKCAHNCVSRGFSLWRLWDDWLLATSVSELLCRILGSLERGHHPTQTTIDEDTERTIKAGGLIALKSLYPNHPSLQVMLERVQGPSFRQGLSPFEGGYDFEELHRNELIAHSRRVDPDHHSVATVAPVDPSPNKMKKYVDQIPVKDDRSVGGSTRRSSESERLKNEEKEREKDREREKDAGDTGSDGKVRKRSITHLKIPTPGHTSGDGIVGRAKQGPSVLQSLGGR